MIKKLLLKNKFCTFPLSICNSIQSCYNYIEKFDGNGVSCSINNKIISINSIKGYNYLDFTNTPNLIVRMNSIPVIILGSSNFRLSIDTSNGSKYSDYTFNGFNTYISVYNFKRVNLDLNWRYYFRIYYENETNNTIQFSKNYSSIDKEEIKITAWLNLTDGSKFNSICSIKLPYLTTINSNNDHTSQAKTIR